VSRAPYLKVYWGDFLASTQAMSRDARKAYLVLLLEAWQRDATLPSDHTVLARLAMCTTKQWNRVRNEVLAKWELCDDGYYRQRRLSAEFRAAGGRASNSGPTITAPGCQQRPNDAKNHNEINDSHSRKVLPIATAIAIAKESTLPPTPHEPEAAVGDGGRLDEDQPQPSVADDVAQMPQYADALHGVVTETEATKASAAQFEAMAKSLYDAAGGALDMTRPDLYSMGTPFQWLQKGASWSLDCIPAVTALCLDRPPASIKSWAFFSSAVLDSLRQRTRPTRRRRKPGKATWGEVADMLEGST